MRIWRLTSLKKPCPNSFFSARISKSWTVGVGSDLTATAQRSKLDVKHPWKHDHSYGSEEVIRNKLVLRSSEVKKPRKNWACLKIGSKFHGSSKLSLEIVQSWGPSPFGIAKKIELKSAAASLDAFVMTAAARVDGAVKLLCGFSKSLLSIHSSIWSIQKRRNTSCIETWFGYLQISRVQSCPFGTAKSSKKIPMSARLTASKICVLWTCTGRTWLKALLKLLLIQIATICYSLLDSPQYSDRANNPTTNHDKAGTGALGRHSNETVRNLLLKRGPHQRNPCRCVNGKSQRRTSQPKRYGIDPLKEPLLINNHTDHTDLSQGSAGPRNRQVHLSRSYDSCSQHPRYVKRAHTLAKTRSKIQ